MSEYQYYEFRAVDRPLDERELRMVRSRSTRGEITPTSFVNTYNWGDFKGVPDTLMEKCFDAFVYVANWGTRRLAFRLPGTLLKSKSLSMYCQADGLRSRKAARQEATWKNVNALIELKQPDKYDLAVGLLRDLRDVAARRNEEATFRSAVRQLCEVHRAKLSFLRRIGESGL